MRFVLDPTAKGGLRPQSESNQVVISNTTTSGSTSTPQEYQSLNALPIYSNLKYKADDISTVGTHAARSAVGTAYPDSIIGVVDIDGTTYGFGADGGSTVPRSIVRTTVDASTGSILTSPTSVTVTGYPMGTTWIAGGATYYDSASGRLVMFAHTEPTYKISLLTSTDDGLSWAYVADFINTGFVSTTDCPFFLNPTTGKAYFYINDQDNNLYVYRATMSAIITWAAGGASVTPEKWTGSTWSTAGSPAKIMNGFITKGKLRDVCWLEDTQQAYAIYHGVFGGTETFLNGYIIDPDEPYYLKYEHDLYRNTTDRIDADSSTNIGYVSILAVDRTVPSTQDVLNIIRVDALSPTPGTPWDNTILTKVELRPAISDYKPPKVLSLDAVGVVANPTGTSVACKPNFVARTVNEGEDVLVWDSVSNDKWRRYYVRSTGNWQLHPEQPEDGWVIAAPVNLDGNDYELLYNVTSNLVSEDYGVQVVNSRWSQLLSDISTNTFIYNSSGAQSGKRYNDWATLMTIVGLNEGRKFIYFEQDETIPAGAYNLDFVSLYGDRVNQNITLTFPTGVTITSWTSGELRDGLELKSTSTAPIMSMTNSSYTFLMEQGFLTSTTAPFFYFTGTYDFSQIVAFALRGGANIYNSGYEAIEIAGPALVFSMDGVAVKVHNDTVRGDGFYGFQIANTAVDSAYPTHTNLTIMFDFSAYNTAAINLGYTNTVSGLAATQVQAAIDELSSEKFNTSTITGTPTGTKYLRDDFSWQSVTATPPDNPQILNTTIADTTISAGYSSYIPYYLEIGSTYTYEVGSGSFLEIG